MNIDHSKYEKRELVDAYVKKLNMIQEQIFNAFELLTKEVESILPINHTELAKESDHNISKYHVYLTKAMNEKKRLINLSSKRDEIEGELNDYYRFHWDKSKLSETAISKYTYAHPVFVSINELVENQKNVVSYLDGVVGAIRDRGFSIKNIIEMRKIELGMK